MREFRFRAWDENEMEMITEGAYIQVRGNDEFEVFREGNEYFEPSIDEFIPEPWTSTGIILMQFTGLEDKNGKKIFEGDLLGYTDEKQSENKTFFEVFYHDGIGRFECCRTHYKGNRCGTRYVPPLNSNHIEVIGNIYENPELLGVK